MTPARSTGVHYLQYSYAPRLRIANGFTQALNGLHDFAALANDAEGRQDAAAECTSTRARSSGRSSGSPAPI